MSTRWSPARTLLIGLLPGAGFLACVSATRLFADPPKDPERPIVRPVSEKTDTTVESMKSMLEKLRKDLGPNDPAVAQLEQTIKALSERKPADKPAAPIDQPLIPQINLQPLPLRMDGDDFFELAKEYQQQMDALRNAIQNRGGFQFQGGGMIGPIVIGPGGVQNFGENLGLRKGRFGIRIETPSPALAAQLDLPNGQGIVCVDVPAESTAGKAGIKPFDILLEVAGKPVPNNAGDFVNQLKDIKADQPIDVVLLRKGRKETIKGVKLPEATEAPAAVINPQEIPVRPFPQRFPQQFPQQIPGGGVIAGEQFSVQQQNNAFTIQYSKDGVKMTLIGDKEGGKPLVTSIEVETNGKVIRADSIEKLPKEYQPMAERAIKGIR